MIHILPPLLQGIIPNSIVKVIIWEVKKKFSSKKAITGDRMRV